MRMALGAPVRDKSGHLIFDACGHPAAHTEAGYPVAFCEHHIEQRRLKRLSAPSEQQQQGGGARASYRAR